ncbi:hypothetical protein NN561_010253 [Cricetulus griseus]
MAPVGRPSAHGESLNGGLLTPGDGCNCGRGTVRQEKMRNGAKVSSGGGCGGNRDGGEGCSGGLENRETAAETAADGHIRGLLSKGGCTNENLGKEFVTERQDGF